MRWLPAVSMMLVSTISYIDRNTLALLAPTILSETHLTNQQYGFIISAFAIAYMFANPVWGWILDRVGVRIGMGAAVSLWTIASVSHALATGFRSFAAVRVLLGFGEGATFPGGLRTVMQTLPVEQRSRGIAIAYSGGSLGAIITPIVITPVAAMWGWQGAFWFTGGVGALWLALWFPRAAARSRAAARFRAARDRARWQRRAAIGSPMDRRATVGLPRRILAGSISGSLRPVSIGALLKRRDA